MKIIKCKNYEEASKVAGEIIVVFLIVLYNGNLVFLCRGMY